MVNAPSVFIGIDVGTQGVRVMALNEHGGMLAKASQAFRLANFRQEQAPDLWWNHVCTGLTDVAGQLWRQGWLHRVVALSVTSTSGTMIPLDSQHQPLSPAIMYSDERSAHHVLRCRDASKSSDSDGYKDFNTSSGLPKILWFIETYPDKAEQIVLWCHATDYVLGQLSGVWGISDYTSVLKTGYDLDHLRWPEYLQKDLNLPRGWLPEVVPSGTVLGYLTEAAAHKTGLYQRVAVVAGMTDGCASQIAAGAVTPGDWNTTIGTTLVVKGVTHEKISDLQGSFYNHKHPQGYWMPGGASNTGADWVALDYDKEELDFLNHAARELIPTHLLTWPLMQNGERFPFVSPMARGFFPPRISRELRYTSSMEGVAYIERMAYERIADLTGKELQSVYTGGGASNSETWLRIRSSVLGVPMVKMRHTEGAAGAAVVAAAGSYFSAIEEAAQDMLQAEVQVDPDRQLTASYEQTYGAFVEELERRGYK
jgi:sugar (pentulose or hexulose) kinase